MLTQAQLSVKLYPQEYWVNVWENYSFGERHGSKEASVRASKTTEKAYGRIFGTQVKAIYRIHVRLK